MNTTDAASDHVKPPVLLDVPDRHTTEEVLDQQIEDDDDGFYMEDCARLVTKEGIEYMLGSPLPPAKGFMLDEKSGKPIVWDPHNLRMKPYVPERVKIKTITMVNENLFRVYCVPLPDSEYKKKGLSIVRTIPISEVSCWDTIVEEGVISGEEKEAQDGTGA